MGCIFLLVVAGTVRIITLRLYVPIRERTMKRCPLTSTTFYTFYYRTTPLTGALAGFFGMFPIQSASQLLFGIFLGAATTTALVYLIVDPITVAIECYFSGWYRHQTMSSSELAKTIGSISFFYDESEKMTEKWLTSLSYWFPRKHREVIVGDLLEDCHELRALGKSEWRIRIHVIWQLALALIMLRPAALMEALKRILSTK